MSETTDNMVRMMSELFRRLTPADMVPVLAMADEFVPGRAVRYASCPLPPNHKNLSWDDDDHRPGGFSPVDPETLEFTYTEQFWDRRVHTLTWGLSLQTNLRSLCLDGTKGKPVARPFSYTEGRTHDEWDIELPPPEQVTAYRWCFKAGEYFLYEVAALYDGYPEDTSLSLDEWASAHWANPRIVTSNPFEILELLAKVSRGGGVVYHEMHQITDPMPVKHIVKYLEHSPELLYAPSGDLLGYLETHLGPPVEVDETHMGPPVSDSIIDDFVPPIRPADIIETPTTEEDLFEGL